MQDSKCPVCHKESKKCDCLLGRSPLSHIHEDDYRLCLPKNNIKVKSLQKTCSAWPTQWDAETEEGYYLYIRFRQTFSVEIAKSKEEWEENKCITLAYFPMLDDDPFMSDERMKELTAPIIRWE